MFYSWLDKEQKDDSSLNSAEWCDCEFCEYYKRHQLGCENLQISSFFEQRIDRKFDKKQQNNSLQNEINNNNNSSIITPLKNVMNNEISFLNTLNNYSSFQNQKRNFVDKENNFNIMRGLLKDENNFTNNLQQFISLYKN